MGWALSPWVLKKGETDREVSVPRTAIRRYRILVGGCLTLSCLCVYLFLGERARLRRASHVIHTSVSIVETANHLTQLYLLQLEDITEGYSAYGAALEPDTDQQKFYQVYSQHITSFNVRAGEVQKHALLMEKKAKQLEMLTQ